MDVLIHISQQLSNPTTPAFEPTAFQVSFNAAAVHMLLFLSLAFVLIDAFLAMLVKGWLQEFDRGWRTFTVAHLRAQERERRLQELERWKLHELIALLPIFIQGALLLFCIGLLVLIFPLHPPSAILCSLIFVFVVGFYLFTTYVSIANKYAPFSSPVSCLLARGLVMVQTWHIPIAQTARRIASAISFDNRPSLSQAQRADADASDGTTQPVASNEGVAPLSQPQDPNSVEKSNVVPRSHSGIDPHTHVHVLERLVATTAEAVENIPVFLELLDQPVKYPTLRPLNMEKWRELLTTTSRLLGDQSTFSVSAAWTLARSMMICYDDETPDEQLSLILQHYLSGMEIDDRRPRVPLHALFTSYLSFRLGYNSSHDLWRTIAFLEPSDAADAELLWMVNTSHRTMFLHRYRQEEVSRPLDRYLEFFTAVLTYISSTEQSRRSRVPLTVAVIYALRTIRSAFDHKKINSVEGMYILPRTISASEPLPMTFWRVDDIDSLDLWSHECIQIAKDLQQLLGWPSSQSHLLNEFRLSLIAALYIDSTKQAHARSSFAGLLNHISTINPTFRFSDAYDHGKLAVYMYMATTQKPLEEDHDPVAALYRVIGITITNHSELQLSGLHIMDIAVKHVNKTTPTSSDWLRETPFGLEISGPGQRWQHNLKGGDHWALLHLETLLTMKRDLLPNAMWWLKWSDTPEKVYIAKARLDLYDSLAVPGHEASKGLKPDEWLLRGFLWSKDYGVCTSAVKWSHDMLPIRQSGTPGSGNSTSMFIPETLGYEWVEHFIHVLCKGRYREMDESWRFLLSGLVPKWTMLPMFWCRDFASALLFSIVQPQRRFEEPAYQCLADVHLHRSYHERGAYLVFLATLLKLVKSSLTWATLTSIEDWLARLPEELRNQDAHTKMIHILANRKQQLQQLTLEFFAELPMAVTVTPL